MDGVAIQFQIHILKVLEIIFQMSGLSFFVLRKNGVDLKLACWYEKWNNGAIKKGLKSCMLAYRFAENGGFFNLCNFDRQDVNLHVI